VLDEFGFDRILLETVGVGQSELDIAAAADTTVVVLVPESGDSIQTMKAGLMEIADIFVINKSDRPGAERLAREVEAMLHIRLGVSMRNVPAHHGVDLAAIGRSRSARKAGEPRQGAKREGAPGEAADRSAEAAEAGWVPPVLRTVAETGDGVTGLVETLDRHRDWLVRTGELSRRRRARLAERVREVVDRELRRAAWVKGPGAEILEEEAAALEAGQPTPYEVAARIVAGVTG
jgi:LAO/AO transport system kinase